MGKDTFGVVITEYINLEGTRIQLGKNERHVLVYAPIDKLDYSGAKECFH